MNQDKLALNKKTEGDINATPAREEWLKTAMSDKAIKVLDKDARYFLHQSMSTPCFMGITCIKWVTQTQCLWQI